MIEQAKSGRVVSALFQASQALEKQWGGILIANVSYDAAHGFVIG